MDRRKAKTRKAAATSPAFALMLLASPFSSERLAASGPSCERYALHDLSPGMSHDTVRAKMGGKGVRTLIRGSDTIETSAVTYSGPASEVYLLYDHRLDRSPPARTVLVRVSMPLSPDTAQTLVDRFGPPDVGADDLGEGLEEGAAVWVDEACGVILTAYRPPVSWWTAEGGPLLQVETLVHARRGGSPASSRLDSILERKNAPRIVTNKSSLLPAIPAADVVIPRLPVPELNAGTIDETLLLPAIPPAVLVVPLLAAVPPVVPPLRQRVTPPAVQARVFGAKTNVPSAPQTLATWRLPASTASTPSSARTTNVPSTPQTLATWRLPTRTDSASSTERKSPGSQTLRTLRTSGEPSDAPAERIRFVPPVLPPIARWLDVKGHVTLAIVVEADGTVAGDPRVVTARPTGLGFEKAALDAVQAWRFNPAIRAGRPVESKLMVGLDFE